LPQSAHQFDPLLSAYRKHGPYDASPHPPFEALWQYAPLGKVERASRDLDKVAECNACEHQRKLEPLDNVGAGDLEQVVLFKLFEHAAFDLDKLIRDQKSEQTVVVGVDGNIECGELIDEDECVTDCRTASEQVKDRTGQCNAPVYTTERIKKLIGRSVREVTGT